jgi:hypothetical protein
MTGHVLKFNKKRTINAPATAIPKDALDPKAPVIETTLMETIVIRKFVQFQLEDIQYQLGEMAKTKGLRPHEFKDAKATAQLLAGYLMNILAELDFRIGEQPPIGTA